MNFDNYVTKRPSVWGMGGRVIGKLLLALLCCDVLLVSTFMLFQYVWLLWILEVIVLAIMIAFLYSPLHLRGAKDRGYYERNQMKPDKLYGLKAGLIGCAPFVLTTVWLILMNQGILPDVFIIYRILNPFFWPLISIFAPSAYAIDLSWYHFVYLFLLDMIIPLTCHFGYTMGLKGIFVGDRILYKNKSKETDKPQK